NPLPFTTKSWPAGSAPVFGVTVVDGPAANAGVAPSPRVISPAAASTAPPRPIRLVAFFMASFHGEWTERQGSNLGKPCLSRGLYRSSGRDQEAGPAPRRRAYRPGLRRSTERAVSTAVPAAAVAAQSGHGDRASPPEIGRASCREECRSHKVS